MDIYFNATDGELELPSQAGDAPKMLAVGEGFYGGPYYERFVLQGLLAKMNGEICFHRRYVELAQIAPDKAIEPTSVPFRYKSATHTGDTGATCLNHLLYTLAFPYGAATDDPVSVTYYFYCVLEAAYNPSHVVTRIERLGVGWGFPTWADLPANFWSLSPQAQTTELLKTA